jgi:aldehyde:ferredoxin oxidoreductase
VKSEVKLFGWTGKILRIDLSKKKVSTEPTWKYAEEFVGSRGVNARILYDESRPGSDPFDPDSRLIFGTGPLTGTAAPMSGRVTVTAKSPLTSLYADSGIGGFWGPELKFAGYDNLVIQGRSDSPVYVWINNDDIEIRKSDHFWGKGCRETEKIINQELGDPEAKSVTIGPGGENLVRYANVRTMLKHAAGRCGMGAVMGSKRLKAVAVRGTKSINIAKPEEFLQYVEKSIAAIKSSPSYEYWCDVGGGLAGRPTDITFDMELAGVGFVNGPAWSEYKRNSLTEFNLEYGTAMVGCFNCPVNCLTHIKLPSVGSQPWGCAPVIDFMGRIMNPDPKRAFECVVLCDHYGIDTTSTAVNVFFAMDCYKRGIITKKDTDGLELEYGDVDATKELIHKIVRREGIGDILAEGVFRASKKIGKNSELFAPHVKGLEVYGGIAIRPLKGYALATAIGPRGDHTRSWNEAETLDVPGNFLPAKMLKEARIHWTRVFGTEKACCHNEYEGKGSASAWQEFRIAMLDCVGMCKFGLWSGSFLTNEELYTGLCISATGVDLDERARYEVAERVLNLEMTMICLTDISRRQLRQDCMREG